MQTYFNLIKDILTISLAFAAFVVSLSSYRRHRTFDNENLLYKHKFDTYAIIFKKIISLFIYYNDEIPSCYEKYKTKKITESEVQRFADELDHKTDLFQDEIILLISMLPKKIVNQSNKILDVIYSDDVGNNVNDIDYNESIKVIEQFDNELEVLENLMREDLGLETLDKRLLNRIRK